MRGQLGRRSTYNLAAAANYAKLAFKATQPDQDRAERIVTEIYDRDTDPRARLVALARAILAQSGD